MLSPVAAPPSAVELLDERVREAVRRQGVDPLLDRPAVLRIVEQAVLDYDRHSLSGAVSPLEDQAGVLDELLARVAGFGPLQRFLDDPSVEEIWINEPSRVFIAREGRHELTTTILTATQVSDLVERLLKTSGRRIDLSTPFVDAMLPSGHRVHVVLDGISRGFSAVNIRKFVVRAGRLDELVDLGTLTPAAAQFLTAAVVSGLNILVAGGTQAGKTTLLNCLGSAIPGRERIVSCEEVFELSNMTILQTCARLYTSDKALTARAPARPSTVSARTASSCALSAAGRSPAPTSTTTSRRPRPSRDRAIRGCWRPSTVVRLRSSSRGTSTGSPANSRTLSS